jgi:hypothetical protein
MAMGKRRRQPMTDNRREQLLNKLESAKADFEKLIQEIGEEGLSKDILAHVTAWEERPVAWAEALARGDRPTPPSWPTGLSEDQLNDYLYKSNRQRPLEEVLARWRSVHQAVLDAIARMSDEELFDRKVDWLGDAAYAEAIAGNSYEHLRTHEGDIRTVLDSRKSQPG